MIDAFFQITSKLLQAVCLGLVLMVLIWKQTWYGIGELIKQIPLFSWTDWKKSSNSACSPRFVISTNKIPWKLNLKLNLADINTSHNMSQGAVATEAKVIPQFCIAHPYCAEVYSLSVRATHD